MGFILWPAALLVFLLWSLAAWLVFSLSDWAAGQVSGVVGAVLTAELGPWATTIINSLGTLIKVGVVAVWTIVGVGILGAPVWLRRQRRAGLIPDSYTHRYQHRSEPRDARRSDDSDAAYSFDNEMRRGGHGEHQWRDRNLWQQRAQQSYGEVSFLRNALGELVGDYRRKKKKKRDDDDD
jgi:hypothetical protein